MDVGGHLSTNLAYENDLRWNEADGDNHVNSIETQRKIRTRDGICDDEQCSSAFRRS